LKIIGRPSSSNNSNSDLFWISTTCSVSVLLCYCTASTTERGISCIYEELLLRRRTNRRSTGHSGDVASLRGSSIHPCLTVRIVPILWGLDIVLVMELWLLKAHRHLASAIVLPVTSLSSQHQSNCLQNCFIIKIYVFTAASFIRYLLIYFNYLVVYSFVTVLQLCVMAFFYLNVIIFA